MKAAIPHTVSLEPVTELEPYAVPIDEPQGGFSVDDVAMLLRELKLRDQLRAGTQR